MTSKKQRISLKNKKFSPFLIVSQHNLPLPAPGSHSHPSLVSVPWSHHVSRPLLKVCAASSDLWAQWRQGQNTDCFAGIPDAPVRYWRFKPRGTFHRIWDWICNKRYRISITRRAKQTLFSPRPMTWAWVYKETAAAVLTPQINTE